MIRSMTGLRQRIGLLDIGIAVVAVALAAAYMWMQVPDDAISAPWYAVPLFALIPLPLLWRRVAPLGASLACFGLAGLNVAALQNDVVRCGILVPLSLLLAFAVGARLDLWRSVAGLAAALGIALAGTWADHPAEGADLTAFLAFAGPILIGVWVVGRLVHSRGRVVGELEARTVELRRARDERARLEVAGDRARLSGELDGLLQRRLGALTALADAGAGAGAGDDRAAADALARIERESRETLEEMRAVVGVLRDDAAGAETAPQPTLTQIDALLVRAKGAGARLSVEGRPRALPAGVELSAYRVVEHLLDALDDAPDVDVRVSFSDDSLELRVAGPMRRRGAAALELARERARLHQGDVAVTTAGGRAEALVSLPIYAAV
ncbi:MAG: sensor histidine kinase [Thermoleophilia bacterium]